MAAGSREICGQLWRHRRAVLVMTAAVLMYGMSRAADGASLCRAVVCTLVMIPSAVLDCIYGKLYHRLSFCLAAAGILLAAARGIAGQELGGAANGTVLAVAQGIAGGGADSVLWAMAGGGLFGLLMLIVFVLGRGSMGFGDVCFAAGLGTFIPFAYILLAFFLTFALGGVGAVLVYAAGAARGREPAGRLPLGPFLAASCLLSILHGEEMVRWYLGVC